MRVIGVIRIPPPGPEVERHHHRRLCQQAQEPRRCRSPQSLGGETFGRILRKCVRRSPVPPFFESLSLFVENIFLSTFSLSCYTIPTCRLFKSCFFVYRRKTLTDATNKAYRRLSYSWKYVWIPESSWNRVVHRALLCNDKTSFAALLCRFAY